MDELEERIKIRAIVTKRTRDQKNSLEVTWQTLVDLGAEQVSKILKEIKGLDMIGAYTSAWISATGVMRLVPHKRVNVARMTPILIYYIIEIGVHHGNDIENRNFKLFYKERKTEKMKTKIFNIEKVRVCIMNEFKLNNEEVVKW